MAQQEPLFTFATEGNKKEIPESIYDGLIEVTEELQELSKEQLERYRVVWESTGHNHSTSYSVRGLGTQFGEKTVEILGGRGGEYYIFPKRGDVPWIKYEHPNEKIDGWEEPLVHLIIRLCSFGTRRSVLWKLDAPSEVVDGCFEHHFTEL